MKKTNDARFKELLGEMEKEIEQFKEDRSSLPAAVRPRAGLTIGKLRDAMDTVGRAYSIYNRAKDIDKLGHASLD